MLATASIAVEMMPLPSDFALRFPEVELRFFDAEVFVLDRADADFEVPEPILDPPPDLEDPVDFREVFEADELFDAEDFDPPILDLPPDFAFDDVERPPDEDDLDVDFFELELEDFDDDADPFAEVRDDPDLEPADREDPVFELDDLDDPDFEPEDFFVVAIFFLHVSDKLRTYRIVQSTYHQGTHRFCRLGDVFCFEIVQGTKPYLTVSVYSPRTPSTDARRHNCLIEARK